MYHLGFPRPVYDRQPRTQLYLGQFPNDLGTSAQQSQDLGVNLIDIFSFLFERHRKCRVNENP